MKKFKRVVEMDNGRFQALTVDVPEGVPSHLDERSVIVGEFDTREEAESHVSGLYPELKWVWEV